MLVSFAIVGVSLDYSRVYVLLCRDSFFVSWEHCGFTHDGDFDSLPTK